MAITGEDLYGTKQKYTLKQNGAVVLTSDQYTVREKIEELLQERLGLFISLQEFTEEGRYEFYLHTDNDEDISSHILDRLDDEYGINTHDEKASEFAIKELLAIEVEEA
jgi:uncharacterized protein YegP (UPF0339 family)